MRVNKITAKVWVGFAGIKFCELMRRNRGSVVNELDCHGADLDSSHVGVVQGIAKGIRPE